MNSAHHPCRLLVIDDDVEPLKALVWLIKKSLWWAGEIKVDSAVSRSSAMRLVIEAQGRGSPYFAVVADYRLPKADGGNPILDARFIEELLITVPNETLVVVTALPSDPALNRAWEGCGKYGIIDKGDPNYPQQVVRFVKERFIEDFVRTPITSHAFKQYIGVEPSWLSRDDEGAGFNMVGLSTSIHRVWPVLDHETRELVKRNFPAEFDSEGHLIDLPLPSQQWWLEQNAPEEERR